MIRYQLISHIDQYCIYNVNVLLLEVILMSRGDVCGLTSGFPDDSLPLRAMPDGDEVVCETTRKDVIDESPERIRHIPDHPVIDFDDSGHCDTDPQENSSSRLHKSSQQDGSS